MPSPPARQRAATLPLGAATGNPPEPAGEGVATGVGASASYVAATLALSHQANTPAFTGPTKDRPRMERAALWQAGDTLRWARLDALQRNVN